MAGYLDTYGVADQRRERIVKVSLISVVSAVLIVTIGYFTLRTHSQEKVMDRFFTDLGHRQYMDAYKLWGCPEQCRLYSMDEFLKDWGPSGKYSNPSDFKVEHVDYCDAGVVFDVVYPNDEFGLWVNRSTDYVSFFDTPRCPGRHLQIGAFLKRLFS